MKIMAKDEDTKQRDALEVTIVTGSFAFSRMEDLTKQELLGKIR